VGAAFVILSDLCERDKGVFVRVIHLYKSREMNVLTPVWPLLRASCPVPIRQLCDDIVFDPLHSLSMRRRDFQKRAMVKYPRAQAK